MFVSSRTTNELSRTDSFFATRPVCLILHTVCATIRLCNKTHAAVKLCRKALLQYYLLRRIAMNKKLFSILVCILTFTLCCFGFVACSDEGGGNEPEPTRDSTKWFTEAELATKGLAGLTAPTGLTGELSTYTYWFNDGYSFRQVCPSEEIFQVNAQTYLDYFKTHYDGLFGAISIEKIGTNENWYVITQKDNLADYFDDNPSKLYKFYYVTDTTLQDGYFKTSAVWSLEIRYEYDTDRGYCFKLYIENAGTTHNGSFTNYYKIK